MSVSVTDTPTSTTSNGEGADESNRQPVAAHRYVLRYGGGATRLSLVELGWGIRTGLAAEKHPWPKGVDRCAVLATENDIFMRLTDQWAPHVVSEAELLNDGCAPDVVDMACLLLSQHSEVYGVPISLEYAIVSL